VKNPLSSSHILLHVVLIGDESTVDKVEESQPALVRRELTVADLMERTLRTFAKEKEFDLNSKYDFTCDDGQGKRRTLDPTLTITESGLIDEATVYMVYSDAPKTLNPQTIVKVETQEMFAARAKSYLRLHAVNIRTRANSVFMLSIEELPTVIGRRPPDPKYPSVGVDLTALEEVGERRISRAHARLSVQDGKLKIESLNEKNPVRVRDRTIVPFMAQSLHEGDVISVGTINLRVEIIHP